jgi:DNA-binding NarL/FixJ family response regulator
MNQTALRAYIADDEAEVREALRLLLEQKLGCQIVGEAAHAHGLISLVDSAHADLVLIDWELPGRVDARLLEGLRQLASRPRIIVCSSYPDLKEAALAAGADAFAGKGDPPELLLAVIRAQFSN